MPTAFGELLLRHIEAAHPQMRRLTATQSTETWAQCWHKQKRYSDIRFAGLEFKQITGRFMPDRFFMGRARF